jgi:hypothetical protein
VRCVRRAARERASAAWSAVCARSERVHLGFSAGAGHLSAHAGAGVGRGGEGEILGTTIKQKCKS